MSLSITQKKEVVAHLQKQMECMKGMVLLDYKGIADNDIKELRNKAHEEGIEYKVCKKTLLTRALKEAGIELDVKKLEGQIAYALSCEDEVLPAKMVAEFAKTHEAVQIVAGILEHEVLSKEAVESLAKLPGKQEMRGQLVGTLQAPISGFVNVLSGNIKGLIRVLSAIKDQKGE